VIEAGRKRHGGACDMYGGEKKWILGAGVETLIPETV
jgi:hypothetical protein